MARKDEIGNIPKTRAGSPPSDTSVSTRLRNGNRFSLAVDGSSECCACFGETGRPERTDLIDEEYLRDDSEIVEAGDAVGGHAIVRSEP